MMRLRDEAYVDEPELGCVRRMVSQGYDRLIRIALV
jgi:hypothetical protein